MTDSLEVSGKYLPVISSSVLVEIENGRGDIVTIERSAAGTESDRNLVTTSAGPMLSTGNLGGTRTDYFVRRSGAAQREAGFHHWFAKFLSWDLPRVTKTDGSESPLYLECLFPYYFVEQKHGWIGLQARIPSYFGIRDVVRRSAEFVLDLDAYKLVLQRQRLEAAAVEIENDWKSVALQIRSAAAAASAIIRGLSERPPSLLTDVALELVIATRDGWITIDDELARLRHELDTRQFEPIPSSGDSASDLQTDLEGAQSDLISTSAALVDAQADLDQGRSRVESLSLRISTLEEDLQRHKDAVLLRRLGSRHTKLLEHNAHCPTCQQNLPDGFDITNDPMSETDNIAFIEDELRAFRRMQSDSAKAIEATTARIQALRAGANTIRGRIRSIKDTLTRPSDVPSVAEIAHRIRLEDQVSSLQKARSEVDAAQMRLGEIARKWVENRRLLNNLGNDRLTSRDRDKISFLNESFTTRLQNYGVTSLSPNEVEISDQTYRPTREGFDLGFDLSASDMIRTIWAYLVSLLNTGVEFATNHARLLVMDEPRQQEVHRTSFEAFLRDVSRHAESQVIVATSEDEAILRAMVSDVQHQMISVPRGVKILQPL